MPDEDEAEEGGLRLAYCDFRREDGYELDLCGLRTGPVHRIPSNGLASDCHA